MKSRRQKEEKILLPPAPATLAQQAEIAGLKQAITDLTYRKLRLYSTLFMLFFPHFAARMGGILLIKWMDPKFELIQEKFSNNYHKREALYKDLDRTIKHFCYNNGIPSDKCLLDFTEMYDNAVYHKTPYQTLLGQKILAKDIVKNYAPVKEELVRLIVDYSLLMGMDRNGKFTLPDNISKKINKLIEKNTHSFLNGHPDDVNTINAYDQLGNIYQSFIRALSKESFQTLASTLTDLRAKTQAKGDLFFLNYVNDIMAKGIKGEIVPFVGVSIGVQHYLVEPLIFRLHQRVIDNRQHPFDNKKIKTQDEAKQLIQSLTLRRNELKKTAENNTWYARRLLLLLTLIIIPLGSVLGLPAIETAIFIFSLLSTALYNSFEEATAWRRQRQFEGLFSEKLTHLEALTPGWRPHKKNTLEESFFLWQATKQDKLSAYIFCRLVRNVLVKHGLGEAIVSYDLKTLAIQANIKINASKAKELSVEIKKNCIRHNQVKIFKQQLVFLSQNIAPYSMMTSSSLGLPIVKLKLTIPNHLTKVITESSIKELFPLSKVTIKNNHLILSGYTPIDGSLLNSFIQKIKLDNITNFKESKNNLPQNSSTKEVFQRIPKGYTAVEEKSLPTSTEKKNESSNQTIRWKSGIFNSKTPDRKIIPYKGKNKFLLFNLKENDFPDEKSYKKFFSKIERQKNAAAFANEGWRHYRAFEAHYEKDSQGNWFKATFDIKTLGEFGKARLYGDKEKDDSGQYTLYVVKGINLDAH